MDKKILKWLYDIKGAIDEINDSFKDTENNFFEYQKNTILKRATERNLEIIGEAVNRILKKERSFEEKITDAVAIVSFRNQIIHAYDNISDENVWSIIHYHLPKLKTEIDLLISQE